jgi:glucose dehydrogenase
MLPVGRDQTWKFKQGTSGPFPPREEETHVRVPAGVFCAGALLLALSVKTTWGDGDWRAYGNDPGSARYTSLAQINTGNVSTLVQAWVYDTKPSPDAKAPRPLQTTPLVVNNVMYFVTDYQSLVAVEPETGKQLWVYHHGYGGRPPRGVAYWPGDKNNPPEILFGTGDGFLIAINAQTGKPVDGFGREGIVDLKEGMKDTYPDVHYGLSSAPVIYRNLVLTGSHTQDSPGLGSNGDLRAWDARTGKLAWRFHTVPQPGETGHSSWLDDGWKDRSGVNAWTTFALDPRARTVFVPFDCPAYDFYGGDRKGANLFGNTVVALDAATGKLKWFFQTVHHDIWDYDAPAGPVLTDVVRGGKKIPALVQAGKTGLVFILDRRDGKPIYEVEERPVPTGDVPGEWYAPMQPVPVKPPPISRQSFTRDEIARVTPEHQKYCEDLFDAGGGAHNDGPFTPMGMHPTVSFPGTLGGANWGSGSVDPNLGYFFINTRDEGAIGRMIKPEEANPPVTKNGLGEDLTQNSYIRTGPYGQDTSFADPKTGWPCQQPPWGELMAINLNTGDIAWRIPFGRIEELESKGIMNTGSVNIGGSVATAGGLLFIGATIDHRFHAYESKTGRLLWETKLAAQAQANPISYQGRNGKQYVVVDAGDSIVAFSLP